MSFISPDRIGRASPRFSASAILRSWRSSAVSSDSLGSSDIVHPLLSLSGEGVSLT